MQERSSAIATLGGKQIHHLQQNFVIKEREEITWNQQPKEFRKSSEDQQRYRFDQSESM